ncbi:DUF7555 family protein [Halostella litorea]|uniref:DUF7555 family protein n=1 Tax=Halostella litorea TaxID=2528831 RepID=UPI0010930AD7|nr:hypothetical protein [Halostella litorea]
MSARGSPLWLRRGVDGVVYAVALAAATFALGVAVSFGVGYGLVGVKYWLFFAGWILLGYGTLKLRPRKAWKDPPDEGVDDQGPTESRFEYATRKAVPGGLAVAAVDRWSAGARLFLGSLFVLAASMALEFAFGVGG